jgi:hypothetical protein
MFAMCLVHMIADRAEQLSRSRFAVLPQAARFFEFSKLARTAGRHDSNWRGLRASRSAVGDAGSALLPPPFFRERPSRLAA